MKAFYCTKINKIKTVVIGNGGDRQGQWRRMRDRDKSEQSAMAYPYKNGVKLITFYACGRPYFKKLSIFITHS